MVRRSAFAVLIVLCALPACLRAAVVTTVAPVSARHRAGDTVKLTVYFLNTGDTAARAEAPASIGGRIVTPGATSDVTLRRLSEVDDDELPPGGFRAVGYELTLPPTAVGEVVAVEVNTPGSPRAVVAVAPAAERATGEVAGTAPATGKNAKPSFGLGREVLPNKPSVPTNDSGIAEAILPRFSVHEPIYFLVGPDEPNAKFQISFKYQLFNPEGSWSQAFEPLAGLHAAYSQTSFWDLEDDSAPFLDSSYRPELLWSARDWRLEDSIVSRVGLQAGVLHESNGRDGGNSRSLNIAYIRPSVTLGDTDGLFVTFAPRLYTYVFGMDATNNDIADYRGHVDLKLVVGERDGLQLSVVGRVGDDWDKGSAQFDLSYPMRRFFNDNVDLYLHAQYFTGYGESLLEYDQYTNRWRLGVSIVR